jgi:hypothetical protein
VTLGEALTLKSLAKFCPTEVTSDIRGLLSLPRSEMVRYSIILNSMIVCSCNVLSDHEVRDVVTASGSHSLTAHEVYGCLGCSIIGHMRSPLGREGRIQRERESRRLHPCACLVTTYGD